MREEQHVVFKFEVSVEQFLFIALSSIPMSDSIRFRFYSWLMFTTTIYCNSPKITKRVNGNFFLDKH